MKLEPEMRELSTLFTRIERQVILLAATSRSECEGLSARRGGTWAGKFLRRIFPAPQARPLANKRLEALRRLACACFGSGGHPDRQFVERALEAGVAREQVATLTGIARRHSAEA